MSTLRVNTITDASGGNTALVNGMALRPGTIDADNRIINGAFDFWQRGTSFSFATYTADRWLVGLSTGSVITSRQSFLPGDTLGPNNPTFFLRQSVSGQTSTSGYSIISQLIEDVNSYSGQTITILGWARRSSGSGNIAVEAFQFFGTGGTPSGTVLVSPVSLALTGSWAPFAVTLSIPSTAGKTLGTNSNDYLAIQFWTSAGSDFNSRTNSLGVQNITVDLWGIHIKVGTHSTAGVDLYRRPELGPELARCQRYYEKSYNLAVAPGSITNVGLSENYFATTAASSANHTICTEFKVVKRNTPSVTVYSPVTGASGNIRDVSGNVDRAATVRSISNRNFTVVNSVTTNNAVHQAQWVADSEL